MRSHAFIDRDILICKNAIEFQNSHSQDLHMVQVACKGVIVSSPTSDNKGSKYMV